VPFINHTCNDTNWSAGNAFFTLAAPTFRVLLLTVPLSNEVEADDEAGKSRVATLPILNPGALPRMNLSPLSQTSVAPGSPFDQHVGANRPQVRPPSATRLSSPNNSCFRADTYDEETSRHDPWVVSNPRIVKFQTLWLNLDSMFAWTKVVISVPSYYASQDFFILFLYYYGFGD
jgi:hypothetical protein